MPTGSETKSSLDGLFTLRGKAALVTGAPGALADAIVAALSSAGAGVALHVGGEPFAEPVARKSPDGFHILVNCLGPDDGDGRRLFFVSQAAHAVMRGGAGGRIIHVGGLSCSAAGGLTRAALTQLTRTMAVEWAKDNVQVNSVLVAGVRLAEATEIQRRTLSRIPARRVGRPQDVAGAVLFFASAAADYVTGQTLVVDGGASAGGSWDDHDAS